jgi:hypothetical protein
MTTLKDIDMGSATAEDMEAFRDMMNQAAQDSEASLQVVETTDNSQEGKLQAARKKARLAPRPEAVRVDTVTEKFAGFNLTINHDPIGKKKGGNGFLIETQGERTAATLRLSLREARALRSFLAKHIPDSE